jgi:hypothetical protein
MLPEVTELTGLPPEVTVSDVVVAICPEADTHAAIIPTMRKIGGREIKGNARNRSFIAVKAYCG